jgi:hypothetical protein
MDPLSITTASLSIVKTCVTVGWEIKKFIDGAKLAAAVIDVLLQNVKGFQKTLEQMNEILEDPRIKDSVQSAGHVGSHWANLKTCLDDAKDTMDSLRVTIMGINKTVSVLDSARKHIRLQSSSNKIKMYQQQIRSYKDTIYVSLQIAILSVPLIELLKEG